MHKNLISKELETQKFNKKVMENHIQSISRYEDKSPVAEKVTIAQMKSFKKREPKLHPQASQKRLYNHLDHLNNRMNAMAGRSSSLVTMDTHQLRKDVPQIVSRNLSLPQIVSYNRKGV